MAMKLNAGDVGRGDMFFIDPSEIIVDDKLNGRWEPHDSKAIALRCKSFEEEGQLQPVQVRRVADNRVQLVFGYLRHAAAMKFNKLHPDKPMKLKAVVVTVNDEEALRKNIVENKERKETTPIDDAHSQRRLRDDYGWNDSKIADFYGVAQSYVATLKKLLALPKGKQKLIHEGKLSVSAAAALTDLPAEEQNSVWEQLPIEEIKDEPLPELESVSAPVTETNGEKLSSKVVKAVREKKIDKGGKQARSLAEVRKFLEHCKDNPAIKPLADLLLKFIEGRLTDKTMESKLSDLLTKSGFTHD